MNLQQLTAEQLLAGYARQGDAWHCLACHETFAKGQVYPIEGHFYEAARAAELHMKQVHPNYLLTLIEGDSKYNPFTDTQRQLLRLFAEGRSDREVAEQTGVALSTVRHQKFTLREKAKQARMVQAICDGALAGAAGGEMMPVQDSAPALDDRFVVSEEERRRILKNAFASLEPPRLKNFPPKEKKKLVILTEIAKQFEDGKKYSEKEVNQILEEVYQDFVTLRRYLVDYRFLARTRDGSEYWLMD